MRMAFQSNGWRKGQICGDLVWLVCNNCDRPQADRPPYFRSTGLGPEGIAMAHGIRKLAQATGKRTPP